jgi:hypothetical protein
LNRQFTADSGNDFPTTLSLRGLPNAPLEINDMQTSRAELADRCARSAALSENTVADADPPFQGARILTVSLITIGWINIAGGVYKRRQGAKLNRESEFKKKNLNRNP